VIAAENAVAFRSNSHGRIVMQGKIRRRLAVIVAGMLLTALALVNVAPVSADDGSVYTVPDPTDQGTNIDVLGW